VTLGVTNNVEFLRLLLADPDVIAGDLDTDLIGRRLEHLAFRGPDARALAAAALVLHALAVEAAGSSTWSRPTGWRIGSAAPVVYRLTTPGAEPVPVRISGHTIAVGDSPAVPAAVVLAAASALVTVDGVTATYRYARQGNVVHLEVGGVAWPITDVGFVREDAAGTSSAPQLRSPMPGAVVAVFVPHGDHVEEGDPVLSIEAMKMEHVLRAPLAGRVVLDVEVGAQVAADQVVASIENEEGTP